MSLNDGAPQLDLTFDTGPKTGGTGFNLGGWAKDWSTGGKWGFGAVGDSAPKEEPKDTNPWATTAKKKSTKTTAFDFGDLGPPPTAETKADDDWGAFTAVGKKGKKKNEDPPPPPAEPEPVVESKNDDWGVWGVATKDKKKKSLLDPEPEPELQPEPEHEPGPEEPLVELPPPVTEEAWFQALSKKEQRKAKKEWERKHKEAEEKRQEQLDAKKAKEEEAKKAEEAAAAAAEPENDWGWSVPSKKDKKKKIDLLADPEPAPAPPPADDDWMSGWGYRREEKGQEVQKGARAGHRGAAARTCQIEGARG